jgi:hypothetical protein
MTEDEKDGVRGYLDACDHFWGELRNNREFRWWQYGVYDHELCCVKNLMQLRLFPLVRMMGWRLYDLTFGLSVTGCDVDAEISVLGFEHDFWARDMECRWRDSNGTPGAGGGICSQSKSTVRELAALIGRYATILNVEIALSDTYISGFKRENGCSIGGAYFIMLRINSGALDRLMGLLVDHLDEVKLHGWDAVIAGHSDSLGYVEYDATDAAMQPITLRELMKICRCRLRWILNDIANCLNVIDDKIVKALRAKSKG